MIKILIKLRDYDACIFECEDYSTTNNINRLDLINPTKKDGYSDFFGDIDLSEIQEILSFPMYNVECFALLK